MRNEFIHTVRSVAGTAYLCLFLCLLRNIEPYHIIHAYHHIIQSQLYVYDTIREVVRMNALYVSLG